MLCRGEQTYRLHLPTSCAQTGLPWHHCLIIARTCQPWKLGHTADFSCVVPAITFPKSRNNQLPRPCKPPNEKAKWQGGLAAQPAACATCISTLGKGCAASQPLGIYHLGECACTGLLQVSAVHTSLSLSSPFTDSDSNFPLCPTLGRLNKPLARWLLCLQPFLFAFTFLEHE